MGPDRLRAVPVFASLDDETLNGIATFATETSVRAGKHLVKEGDYAYEFMAIGSTTRADAAQRESRGRVPTMRARSSRDPSMPRRLRRSRRIPVRLVAREPAAHTKLPRL